MPITFGNVGLAEPSTITKVVASVVIARGSTSEHQEILVIGDPQSSLGLARVIATAPTSTEFGQVVRIASGPSSAADLQVQIAGNSTVLQGTSPWIIGGNSTVAPLAGSLWTIQGNSTVAPLAGSTWNVRALSSSKADFLATVSQSTAADLLMTATQGTNPWIVSPNSTAFVKTAGLSVDSSNALNVKLDGSTVLTVQPLAGSTFNVRALNSSAGDFLVTVSGNCTVAPLAGSTWNVRALNSSAGDFLVTISGNSTVAPLAGSTWATRPIQSSAADLQMTATPAAGSTWSVRPIQSSAADLQVTCTPVAGSTWSVRPIQSSQADLRVTAYQSSAAEFKAQAWNFDGIGNAIESSTRAVGTNSTMRGVAVRSILPALLTTASSNVFATTNFTIGASNAATIQYVYAYSITTTNQTPTQIGFFAGSTLVWPIVLAAISSAMSGVNLAVSPPAYLFAGSTGAVMQLKTDGSTGLGYKAGVSYWTE